MKIKTFLLLMLVIFVQLFLLPWIMIRYKHTLGLPTVQIPILQYFGVLLLISCVIVILHCKNIFRIVGKGTPVPIEPPKEFVASGLYRFVRNPMYVSYITIYIALFFVSGSLLLLFFTLLCIPAIHLAVVLIEEPSLEKRFGNTYLEYKKRVKRWGLF
jgi:protein-S-isoprenylcysteine O-methyltransferase Ste14